MAGRVWCGDRHVRVLDRVNERRGVRATGLQKGNGLGNFWKGWGGGGGGRLRPALGRERGVGVFDERVLVDGETGETTKHAD